MLKITLITVCWNSVRTIGDALESVARQKLEGYALEYLVIDGGSTDGTVEVIRSFAQRLADTKAAIEFRWVSEKDRGMYDALNKGIKMSTGDVVGILNADDLLDGNDVLARIAACWANLEAVKGELECLFGNVRFVDAPGGRTLRVCFARWWRPWMLQWGYMPPHPGVYILRRCFEQWGGYVPDRTEYKIAADYELLIRFFRMHRMKSHYMPICTTAMRMGGMSTQDVEARRRLNAEIIKGNRANGYRCCWPMLLPKYIFKVWEVILPRLGLSKW